MKPQTVLTTLVLQSILLTVVIAASTEQPHRPYYLFRCDDDSDSGKGSSSSDADGDADAGNGEYGVANGYMPYPTRRKHRALAGGKTTRRESEEISTPPMKSGERRSFLFPKCAKSKGAKSKSGKSSGDDASSDSSGSDSSGGDSSGGNSPGSKPTNSKASKSGSSNSSSSSSDHIPSPSSAWSSSPTTRPPTPNPTNKPEEIKEEIIPDVTPTPKPTKDSISEATFISSSPTSYSSCDALSDGDFTETNKKATLTYTYEAAVSDEAEVEWITDDMEDGISLFVGRQLMDCDDDERRRRLLHYNYSRLGSNLLGRRLGDLEVVGVDSANPSDAVDEEKSCKYFTGTNEIEETDCHVISGGMTLYLSESEPLRRRKLSEEEELEESTEYALQAIMEAMNDENPSPFVEETDGEYAVWGLMGVRYVSGTTNDGEGIEEEDDGDGSSGSDDRGSVNGVKDGGEKGTIQSSQAVAIGGSLLGVGLLALVVLALAVVVRNKLRPGRYNEFFNEDTGDDDLNRDGDFFDDKETDADTSSLKSTPSTRGSSMRNKSYIVGEEGSIYTNATHDTRFLYGAAYGESGNGNDDDDDQQVDVHHCTSAMCPICNGKETVFVNASDEREGESVDRNGDPEGYEFSYDPRRGGSNASSRSPSMKKSFAYEPKEDVSNPSFDNPAGMTERPYVVDDTIDF